MKYVLAYGLAIVLARFWYTLGTFLVTVFVSGCLAWAPERLRGVVAGLLSGLGGVAAAVVVGYLTFRLIAGWSIYGQLPLLAATVPLIIPIRKEFTQARVLADDLAKARDFPAIQNRFVAGAVGVKFRVIGAILGLVVTFFWFFLVYENGP